MAGISPVGAWCYNRKMGNDIGKLKSDLPFQGHSKKIDADFFVVGS
jgi:hypothetical protein